MSKENGGFTLFTGIVLGGLIGAAAGLLLAPLPGVKTRKIVKKKIGELVDVTQDKIEPAIEDVQQKADQFKKTIKSTVADIQSEIRERTK